MNNSMPALHIWLPTNYEYSNTLIAQKGRERLWRLSSATVSSHGGQLNQVNRGWASGLPCHIRETQLWYKGDPTPTSVRPNSLIGVTSIRDSVVEEWNLLPMSSRPDYHISHVLHVCHVRRKNHQDPTICCGVICWKPHPHCKCQSLNSRLSTCEPFYQMLVLLPQDVLKSESENL